jgi:hypothetical protein
MLSQGTSFTFSSTAYTVTRVTVNRQWEGSNRAKISTAHLGSSIDQEEPYVFGFTPRSDEGGSTVEVEFLGGGVPAVGAVAALTVAGAAAFSTTAATCVSSSVTATVGDLVRGSASFRIKV